MRFIVKRNWGGHKLHDAHDMPPQNVEEARSRWHSFKPKPDVLKLLLQEQHHLCCYSEVCADELGLGFHIEHIENKSQNPQRTFAYDNLAASALDSGNLQGRSKEDCFGGHAPGKQKGVNMSRFIFPHLADCGRFFAYLSDGRVEPSLLLSDVEKDKAQYTIDLLNLNSPYLIVLRQQKWQELEALFDEHMKKSWNLQDLIEIELTPCGGRLYSFFSLARQFFRR